VYSQCPAGYATPAIAPAAPPPLTPAVAPASGAAGAKVWFWGKGGVKNGPFTAAEMRGLYGTKQIASDTLVWRAGLPRWVHLSNAAQFTNLVQWFYGHGGRKVGPVTALQIRQLVQARSLTNTILVWRAGLAKWAPLRTLPEFSDLAQ
jgi:hypothetical protein